MERARPEILTPLFKPLDTLPGVGPKILPRLAALVAPSRETTSSASIVDLLFHAPIQAIDRSRYALIARAPEGTIVTLKVCVDLHRPPLPGARSPYKIFVSDESGSLTLSYFNAQKKWLESLFPIGAIRFLSGKVEWFAGSPQMVHPDYVVSPEEVEKLPRIEPIYPLTEGVSLRSLNRIIGAALNAIPLLPEWQDHALLAQRGWLDFPSALRRLHQPLTAEDVGDASPILARLAYDEILASQLALSLIRRSMRMKARARGERKGLFTEKIRKALPFALTKSQEQAIKEIEADLSSPNRMIRLIQGDVGSGKTLVGLFAAAIAIDGGGQAAFMAPTELLARQHARAIASHCEAAGLRLALLTGKDKGKERQTILEDLASGKIDILVGTHALFQESVVFHDLALAVIDEQHRFGVYQRLTLSTKGHRTDLLVMTATPIPRTLLLSYFGDMDVSQLTDKPPGRKPVTTRTISLERLDEVVERIGKTVRGKNEKVYWVCPMVEENAALDLAAAEARYRALQSLLGNKVELVHGRMSAHEKDERMRRFQSGEANILVATTVIEVGVDVPDATIMVIEHAERFGLAQLHQLRGRVGRGDKPSTCLLLFKPPLGHTAKERLAVMRETEDGFLIAEKDLKLRGGGEVLGIRQSGMPGFHFVRPGAHGPLFEIARKDAARILLNDPALETTRGKALRTLLYLFGRDEAIKLIRAG